jgi:hypothetical protein
MHDTRERVRCGGELRDRQRLDRRLCRQDFDRAVEICVYYERRLAGGTQYQYDLPSRTHELAQTCSP